MADKKWYSMEDVELAKAALSELPDLTTSRLRKSDVLEQLKEKIIELSARKGYSAEDIRSAL
ncbi:molybdopterin-guanine dinucleotide biosynthesis protein MobC, partial [Salmonella enterica]|nr:molybdopterin-guanine dinucleotide biosynthesis protein MobC [Salmonella enterica]